MTRRRSVAARLAIVGLLTGAALAADATARRAEWRLRPQLGLVQTVYGTRDFTSAVYARQTTALDLALLDERADLPQRDLSIRWEGVWLVPRGGLVRLHAGVDDEVRVWIDDRLIVDRDFVEGFRTHIEPLDLDAGIHRMRIEYVQKRGDYDLSLLWAPAGGTFRRFAPSSLFPREPGDDVLSLVARAGWVHAAGRLLWLAAALAAVLFFVPFAALPDLVVRLRAGVRRTWLMASRLVVHPRVQAGAAIGLAVAVLGWAVAHRLDALNPVTFWADDVWVVALASRPSLIEALTTPAPVPPGFVLLQWLVRRLSTDPGVSLQLLPLAFGLAAPLVLGLIIRRVTGSAALGLAAVALGLLDPFIAQQSVLSKPYSLDALAAACLIAIAVRSAEGPPVPLVHVGLAGVFALLFSFPSIFVSVPVFHVLAWQAFRAFPGWGARRRTLGTVAAFNVAMAAVYVAVLRPRASLQLFEGWRRSFLPADDFDAGITFVSMRWSWFLEQVLPAPFRALTALVFIGLMWLLVRRRWRSLGASLVLSAAALVVANWLGWYPIGVGYYGRVLLFLHVLVLLLFVGGAHAVTRVLGSGRAAANALAAAVVLVYLARAPVEVTYFDHNHSGFVAALGERLQPDDALLVNTMGSYLLYVYGDMPADLVRNQSPNQFHLQFHRPRTLTVPVNRGVNRAPVEPADLERVREFLEAAGALRLFYLSTRRDTGMITDVIEHAGYERVAVRSSTTATFLTEFHRARSTRAAGAAVTR